MEILTDINPDRLLIVSRLLPTLLDRRVVESTSHVSDRGIQHAIRMAIAIADETIQQMSRPQTGPIPKSPRPDLATLEQGWREWQQEILSLLESIAAEFPAVILGTDIQDCINHLRETV